MPIGSSTCPSATKDAWIRENCPRDPSHPNPFDDCHDCISKFCLNEDSRSGCRYSRKYDQCMRDNGCSPNHWANDADSRFHAAGSMVSSPAPLPETPETPDSAEQLEEFDRMRYDMCIEKGSSDHVCKTMLPVYHR